MSPYSHVIKNTFTYAGSSPLTITGVCMFNAASVSVSDAMGILDKAGRELGLARLASDGVLRQLDLLRQAADGFSEAAASSPVSLLVAVGDLVRWAVSSLGSLLSSVTSSSSSSSTSASSITSTSTSSTGRATGLGAGLATGIVVLAVVVVGAFLALLLVLRGRRSGDQGRSGG